MSSFGVNMPSVLFGTGSRNKLGEKLKEHGCTTAILVYDAAMGELGFADELLKIITASGICAVGYKVEDGEPSSDKVDRIYAFAKEKNPDGIVGFGGGNAMDTAKFLGLMLANGGEASEYLGYANNKAKKRFPLIITMPTTAGTGAEVTSGLVCQNDKTGNKTATMSSVTYAIVDPGYTVSLPKAFSAGTGIDALTHAVESIFNTKDMPNWTADMTGSECIRLVYKYLPLVCEDGKNLEAREKMSWAALMGGYTIANRKTTYGHLFANQVSDTFHYPHSVGVSMALSSVVRYIARANPDATRLIARALDIPCPENGDTTEVGAQIVQRTDALQKLIGMKTMKENGLTKEFIASTIEKMKNDSKWKVVPVQPDWDLVLETLYEAYEL